MAIDITKDKLISLEDAAKMFPKPGGGHLHSKTIKNWIIQGYQGIVLEGAQVGSKFYTTTDALRQFSRQLSERRPAAAPDEVHTQAASVAKNGAIQKSPASDDYSDGDAEFDVAESDTATGKAASTAEISCPPVRTSTGGLVR